MLQVLSGSGSSGAWTLTTLAGSGTPGFVDGIGVAASFDTPTGVATLADGSVIVADTGNDALRRVAVDGSVTTVSSMDFSGSSSAWRPVGVAAGSQGRLYVTDARAQVVELVPDGGRRVLAGAHPGFANGLGTAALMREPSGIAVAAGGRLVVADTLNGLIRVLDLPERLAAWTPTPPALAPGFDLARFARVPLVWPIDPQEGPHEVAGTLGEPRGNPGGDGRERFHAGVDVRADMGQPVRAIRDGIVSSVLSTGSIGTLNEFLTVGPLTYVHLRVGRDQKEAPVASWAKVLADPVTGKPARVRVRRGTYVAAGDVIGTVNRFRHVHLNVGPPGEEANAAAGRFARSGRHGAAGDCRRQGSRSPISTGHPLTERVRNRLRRQRPRARHRRSLRSDGRQPATATPRRLPRRLSGAAGRWHADAGVRASAHRHHVRPPAAGRRCPALAVRAGQWHPVLRDANDALPLPGDHVAWTRARWSRRPGCPVCHRATTWSACWPKTPPATWLDRRDLPVVIPLS